MSFLNGATEVRSGETDRKKIYAGKLAIRSIYEELFRPGKSDSDWLKLIPQVCWKTSEAKALIDMVMTDGPPRGTDEKLFVSRLLVQLTEKLNNMDNLTRVGAMSYQEELYEPFFWFSEAFYLSGFRRSGICAGVSGNLGSGKTHFTWILIEMALRAGFEIVTNMWFDRDKSREAELDVDKIHIVKYFSDVMTTLSGPGKKLLVLDEVSQFFDRKTAMARENIELEHFLRLMRKLNTSAIFVEQDPNRYPTLFEYFMSVYYFKPTKKRVEITIYQPDVKIHRFIDEVPGTTFVWDTNHPASFYVDLAMERFNDLLVQRDTFTAGDLPDMVKDMRTRRPGEPDKSESKEGDPTEVDPVEAVTSKIRNADPEIRKRWLNKRYSFDWMIIRHEFQTSENQAKVIARLLDREFPKDARKTW